MARERGQRGLGRVSLHLLEQCALIIPERAPISVRGVCYQLFVRQLLASMAKNETDKISKLLTYAREHNIVRWDHIVDETRQVERPGTFRNLGSFAAGVARAYRRDFWTSQAYDVQVWSEKATVGGILRPVTDEWGVSFMAVHGFGSATALHDAALESVADASRLLVILYVGDHDPSGMHMSEVDIPERLRRYGGQAIIRRIALEIGDLFGLPHFPAKQSDPRYKWYRARYGEHAWELDAMDPNLLRARVAAAIQDYINKDAWDRMRVVEEAEQETVRKVALAMAS